MSYPTVIAVNSTSPYRTLTDLLDAARAKPGELALASIGPATAFHIAIESLKRATKVDMTFIPYPGGAPALNALLGEHVTSAFLSYSTMAEQLGVGKLRAIATWSRTRIESLPEVPTVAESGYKDYEMDEWNGVLAPARTPKNAVSQLPTGSLLRYRRPRSSASLSHRGSIRSGCAARISAPLFANNPTHTAPPFVRRTSKQNRESDCAAVSAKCREIGSTREEGIK